MKYTSAIGGGIIGAVALTLIHETGRRINPKAPRMDLLGMDAITKSLRSFGVNVPKQKKLFELTMAGDILSNSLYYSLAGVGGEKQLILRGTLLGLAAGIGAVYLPEPLGLNEAPTGRTTQTKLMTVALYTTGGFIAAAAAKYFEDKD